MKLAEIIEITRKEIKVFEYDHHYNFGPNFFNEARQIIGSSDFVFNQDIEVLQSPLERVTKNNVDYNIAVHPDVWEFLYCLENPVTGKTQQDKIQKLHEKVCNLQTSYDNTSNAYVAFVKNAKSANLWTRIKWVLTGFKG